jgi:hypothetical protein
MSGPLRPKRSKGAVLKYLCLVYIEEAKRDALPAAEFATLVNNSADYIEELKRSNHYIAAEPLHPVSTAVTVRVRNGKPAVTDGPFAETKEQLGGFFLVEARDLNEAIRIAERIPPARIGSIEVRAIRPLQEYVEIARRRSTNE